jgi:uncharacterized membrane protein
MDKINHQTEFSGNAKKMLVGLAVCAFLATLTTVYLTYMHYAPSASEVCTINESFNCDIVNKSEWSYIPIGSFELPVSILGFLYYLGVFIGVIGLIKGWKFTRVWKWLEPLNLIRLMKWLTVAGVAFTLYLTYIETFYLKTYCIFCLAQQVLIIIMLCLFMGLRHKCVFCGEAGVKKK